MATDLKILGTASNLREQLKSRSPGPKTPVLVGLLDELCAALAAKTKTEPKAAKVKRAMPPGSFNPDRKRTLVFDGKTYDAPTIAKGVCAVFGARFRATMPTEAQQKLLAAAVSEAFPNNNYLTYRVEVDWEKFVKGQFTFLQANAS